MQTAVDIAYHQTLDELPLNKFIECIVDGNLAALIISGIPTEEQLSAAWETISHKYIERIGTNEYKMYVALYKEINLLKISLNQVNIIAQREDKEKNIEPGILRLYYVEKLAKELNSLLKTNCTLNYNDPKSYHAELDKCIRRSKSIKIQLDLKLLTFDAIEKKNKGNKGQKMDREYFTSILVTLSDHAKYQIADNIKMGEYCERLKRFIQYCEKSKK